MDCRPAHSVHSAPTKAPTSAVLAPGRRPERLRALRRLRVARRHLLLIRLQRAERPRQARSREPHDGAGRERTRARLQSSSTARRGCTWPTSCKRSHGTIPAGSRLMPVLRSSAPVQAHPGQARSCRCLCAHPDSRSSCTPNKWMHTTLTVLYCYVGHGSGRRVCSVRLSGRMAAHCRSLAPSSSLSGPENKHCASACTLAWSLRGFTEGN